MRIEGARFLGKQLAATPCFVFSRNLRLPARMGLARLKDETRDETYCT